MLKYKLPSGFFQPVEIITCIPKISGAVFKQRPATSADELGVQKRPISCCFVRLRHDVRVEAIEPTRSCNPVSAISRLVESFNTRRRVFVANAVSDETSAVKTAQAIARTEPHEPARVPHQVIDKATAETVG